MTGLVTIAALYFINPDHLIASVNLQRAREGKNFDPSYNALLSADAAPILLNGAGTLLPEARVIFETQLGYHWGNYSFGDWRSWNLSRHNLQKQMNAEAR